MPKLEHSFCNTGGVRTKGTLHAHGPHTGGKLSQQKILDLLAAQNYGFAMVVEHDALPPTDEFAQLDVKNMLLLRGCELTRGPHLLHINAQSVIEDQSDPQHMIDQALGQNGLIVAAHPSFGAEFDHIPARTMMQWRGLTGLEIYNPYIHRTHGSAFALDKWDQLLSHGQRVWGFADDDAFSEGDIGRAFIVVHTDAKPTVDSIIDAMRRGDFYASSGLHFERLECDGMTIRMRVPGARRLAIIGSHGARLATVRGDTLEFTVPNDAKYVRIEAAGEPDEFAWSQPFFVVE